MPALSANGDDSRPDSHGPAEADVSATAATDQVLTRVTVNLRRSVVVALDGLIAATGSPKTDIINTGVLALAVLYDIKNRNGGNIVVLMDNGDVERIHLI